MGTSTPLVLTARILSLERCRPVPGAVKTGYLVFEEGGKDVRNSVRSQQLCPLSLTSHQPDDLQSTPVRASQPGNLSAEVLELPGPVRCRYGLDQKSCCHLSQIENE